MDGIPAGEACRDITDETNSPSFVDQTTDLPHNPSNGTWSLGDVCRHIGTKLDTFPRYKN